MNTTQTSMRKLSILAIVLVLVPRVIIAREIRSPLALQWGYGYMHYPEPRPKDDDCGLNVDVWAAGYMRFADKAFLDKNTTKTEPLAGIFFNQASFTGIQAFVPGSFDPLNPFLQFATINPLFDYNEKGIYFNITVDHAFGCDGCWHAGVRANIPFKSVKTELDSCCDLVEDDGIDDVCVMQREQVADANGTLQVIQNAYAYRLDFLSSLYLTVNAPKEPLVKYHNPTNNDITMNEQRISDFANNPVTVIERDNGTPPNAPFTLRQTTNVGGEAANNLPFLAADGSGVANNARARFSRSIDYTPLSTNKVNQKKLWVVPTASQLAPNFGLVGVANALGNLISSLAQEINPSVIDFFLVNGVTFDTQRSVGVGDTTVQVYANHAWCDWWAEVFVGAMFPSGKRLNNPGLLLKQLSGNNGHYVFQLGGYLGWEGLDWLNIKLDAMYSYAIPRTEKVAAAFQGALVKNIGPTVDAKVSWQYFVADLDFTFLVPCNPRVGVDIGYELYVKGRDHVSFADTTATDFFGVVQPLDASVIEERTKGMLHKARTELFYQADNWELFAGFMHAFAGKNAPKETDVHLGFIVYF